MGTMRWFCAGVERSLSLDRAVRRSGQLPLLYRVEKLINGQVRISSCSCSLRRDRRSTDHLFSYMRFRAKGPRYVAIMSPHNWKLIQTCSDPSLAVFRPGSDHPAAILFDALDHFERKSPKADESIRSIRPELANAVDTCIEAAGRETEPHWQKKLLRVSSHLSRGQWTDLAVLRRHNSVEPLWISSTPAILSPWVRRSRYSTLCGTMRSVYLLPTSSKFPLRRVFESKLIREQILCLFSRISHHPPHLSQSTPPGSARLSTSWSAPRSCTETLGNS